MVSPIGNNGYIGVTAPFSSTASKSEVVAGKDAVDTTVPDATPPQESQGDSVELSEAYKRFRELYDSGMIAYGVRPDSKYICDGMDQPGRFVEGEDGYFRWLTTKDEYLQNDGLQGLLDNWDREQNHNPDRVERLKAAVDFLVPEKKEISEIIERLGRDAGISKSDISKLKIEMDSKGKIVVGGIKNKKKLKAMEKALNKESGLASQLENYQTAEMILLQDTIHRGSDAKTIAFRDYNSNDENSVMGAGYLYYSQIERRCKELDNVDDLDGLLAPEDYALAELYRDKTPTADFSFGQKGVANPEAALEKWAGSFSVRLKHEVARINKRNDAVDDPQRMVNLEDIRFKVTSDGSVEVIGRLSNDDVIDGETKAILAGFIRDAVIAPGEEGRETLFETAAAAMLSAHDEAFGDARRGKSAVLEFDSNGKNAQSYIDAPGAKEEISREMSLTAMSYINTTLGDKVTTADDFSVDDSGVLTYNGGNARVAELFDELWEDMSSIRSSKSDGDEDASLGSQAAQTLVRLTDEFNSYGPDADNSYQNGQSIDEAAYLVVDKWADVNSRFDYKYAGRPAHTRGGSTFTWGNYKYQPYYTEEEKQQRFGKL